MHGYIVAIEENEVVGCIGGACANDVGLIYVFYIKPEMKGKGVGGALLDFLTDYQKEQFSITSQKVHVTTGNRMGIPFYEKNGFKLIKVIPNWIDESKGCENLYRRQV